MTTLSDSPGRQHGRTACEPPPAEGDPSGPITRLRSPSPAQGICVSGTFRSLTFTVRMQASCSICAQAWQPPRWARTRTCGLTAYAMAPKRAASYGCAPAAAYHMARICQAATPRRAETFQRCVTSATEMEHAAVGIQYAEIRGVPCAGPAHLVLGNDDQVDGAARASVGVTALPVNLAPAHACTFATLAEQTVAWLAASRCEPTSDVARKASEVLVFGGSGGPSAWKPVAPATRYGSSALLCRTHKRCTWVGSLCIRPRRLCGRRNLTSSVHGDWSFQQAIDAQRAARSRCSLARVLDARALRLLVDTAITR